MKCRMIMLTALLMFSVMVFFGCAANNRAQEDPLAMLPEEAQNAILNYLEAWKEGNAAAEPHTYFGPEYETERQAFLANPGILYEYKVVSAEKINDKLYAVTLKLDTNSIGNEGLDGQDYYRFAGEIDGDWYCITNVRHVPEELREGLDSSKYQYENSLYNEDSELEIQGITSEQ